MAARLLGHHRRGRHRDLGVLDLAGDWMQAPAGHEVRDGVAYPVDWLTVIFNPTFFYRLPHMLTAAYLTTSFVVLSVGARYILAARHIDEGRTMMHMAIGMLAALGPLQVFIGDEHGRNALEPTASHATSGSNRGRRLAKVHRATEWLKPSFARSSTTMSASVRDQMPKPSCVSCQLGSPAQGSRISFTP